MAGEIYDRWKPLKVTCCILVVVVIIALIGMLWWRSWNDILNTCKCDSNVEDGFILYESGLPFHAQKTYPISGSTVGALQIVWDEYDFRMEIPRAALSDVGDGEFNITISVIKSGHVQFPSRTKPVSAVYGIRTVSFSEPVTIELEHCCEINTFTSGSLVFGVANEIYSAPYKFEKLEGGIFPEGHHGRITTAIAGSSLFVILLKQQANTEMPAKGYLAYFLYEHQKSINRKVWEIHIAVVQNTEASKQIIAREYQPSDWKVDGSVKFDFAGEYIYLGWSNSTMVSKDGCSEFVGKTPDRISRDVVDHNELDHVQCSLIDTGDCTGVLKHKFVLHGTREPCLYTMTFEKGISHVSPKPSPHSKRTCSSADHPSGMNQPKVLHHTKPPGYNNGGCHSITKLQELEKAVSEIRDWDILCEYLGVQEAVLSDLHSMINTDNTIKKHRCLKAYINTGKACWETVVKVVDDHPFYNARLAKEIANMHGVIYSKDEL